MKRLVEDFDDMMNIEDEVSVEDTKSPLEKELIRVYEYLKDKGETDIKAYEVAYQEAIENIYPENSWWEVIDLNIFWDLFENQNPRTTIDNIISSIKPEFKKEVIDTVVTEDIDEENPLKDIRSNIIEFPNGEYAYVEYADGKLYAGSATNRGVIHEYEMDYDKDFDVDRNLQNFFDKIIEENPELGEPLDESKKVCEDTVKQGNKWVNKGKDGTHGTFRTKKAADAQRKAMFANKGKKSNFGESFKVGDTFTNAGEEWEILRSEGDYTLVYAKDRKFHPYVVVYRLDDDGTWAQGHYFSNKDSAEKFLMNETGSVNESKQHGRSNRCVTEAKKEKLDKSTKQNVKVFDELFNGLSHWSNNFSAYASTDEPANKKNIQKLFKKVDSMISDATTFANRFKVVYKSLLAAGITLDKSPSTIKRLSSNLSQKYMKMSEKWRDDKSDRAKNGNLADVYYAYASAFEDLSDYVDEVNAEYNKDIKENLSKKTKAKRIYESMKRKRDRLKESRLSDNSSTNFKDSPTEGYVYTYCDECGKKNRVKVVFNSFKEPFNDTEYKCEYCGTHNMLTDPHKYDEDGRVYDADGYDEGYSVNYGGAYDVNPESYFTREDLVGFAQDVVDVLNDISFSRFDYTEVYLEPGNNLALTITWSDYEETIKEHIDMRKIRKPSDLYKVYGPLFIDRAKELFSEYGADFDLHLSDQDYPLSEKQDTKRIYGSMKRKPKKNLKEAADDEIKLFMNTWANYNENGADDGITPTGWMSLDEAEEYAEKYAEYEPFINDTENVPEELGVNEYSGVSETIGMLRDYEGFDDEQKEVFAAFIDNGYNVEEAFRIVDIGDYLYVGGDNTTELAETYIEDIGGIEQLDRDTLERYFDYDGFGRDIAYDFIETENGYVSH